MAIANGTGLPVDFVQFSSKPKKGKVPHYLLAAQVRRRFLEQPQYHWRRQVKGAALTGNPERFIEIYRVSPLTYQSAIDALNPADPSLQPSFQKQLVGALVDDESLDVKENKPGEERFIRMDYLGDVPASELAVEPYLLHTTITLQSNADVPQFAYLKAELLRIFAQRGLKLIVAGQKIGDDGEVMPVILNVWSFNDVEEVESLMMRLSDNLSYYRLNMLGTQEQHIYRNVSRHYQFFPLLTDPHLRSRANP